MVCPGRAGLRFGLGAGSQRCPPACVLKTAKSAYCPVVGVGFSKRARPPGLAELSLGTKRQALPALRATDHELLTLMSSAINRRVRVIDADVLVRTLQQFF